MSREFSVADHWYPKESKQQAEADVYLEWQHLNVRLLCASFFQHKVSHADTHILTTVFIIFTCVGAQKHLYC